MREILSKRGNKRAPHERLKGMKNFPRHFHEGNEDNIKEIMINEDQKSYRRILEFRQIETTRAQAFSKELVLRNIFPKGLYNPCCFRRLCPKTGEKERALRDRQEDVLEDYPNLSKEDVKVALRYAAACRSW